MREQYLEVQLYLHWETERSVLVSKTGDKKDAQWLVRNKIDMEYVEKNIFLISMPTWLAYANKWVEEKEK